MRVRPGGMVILAALRRLLLLAKRVSPVTLSQSQIVLATPIYFSTKGTIISKHKRRDQSPGAIERSTSQGA